MGEENYTKRIESKLEVQTYLAQLKYALNSGNTRIVFQKKRHADENRDERYTNRYTIHTLFPDEDEIHVLKRELLGLSYRDYIETVKDTTFPGKSEMRVFGKTYSDRDVYIKIRVELLSMKDAIDGNFILVMSYHIAEEELKDSDFPYR